MPEPTSNASARSVLLVGDALGHGGVEAYIVALANRLVADGVPVAVQALAGGELWQRLVPQVGRQPVPRSNPVGESVARIRLTRRHARGRAGLLVHGHQRIPAFLAKVALTGLRVPTVEHVHNVFASRGVVRLLSFRADVLVACGTKVADMLVEGFGRPRSRVRVVLNGVAPADPASLQGLREAAADPGELRILAVGRLSDQKDPLRFLRVVAAIVAAAPEIAVRASWVGDGPLREPFLAEIRRLGLQDVVTLVGQVPDAGPWFAEHDLLLLTSAWEGLPLVALEGLARGRGVVLPDVGSCIDAVAGGEVGAVYSHGVADEEVASLVLRAFRDGDVRRWGSRAVEVHRERFTYDRMVREVEGVYDEVWSRSRSR